MTSHHTGEQKNKNWIEYLILIGGIILLIIGFFMLIEIAVGLALLLIGAGLVNRYLGHHKEK